MYIYVVHQFDLKINIINMGNGQTCITAKHIEENSLCEISDLVKNSFGSSIEIEKEALADLLQTLLNNQIKCCDCGKPHIIQEFVNCTNCKKSNTCKKCVMKCAINSTHIVHKNCMTSCELCGSAVCNMCINNMTLPSSRRGRLPGNYVDFVIPSKVCETCKNAGVTMPVCK